MTPPTPTVHPADPAQLDRVEALLAASGLPTGDVREKPECFSVATVEGSVVGAGGVERRGSDGLLRSIVVAESERGEGYGTVLCDELEAEASRNGVDALYLLTTTAAPFFRRRGYEELPRDAVPEPIQGTAEFESLCPASATCMAKDL